MNCWGSTVTTWGCLPYRLLLTTPLFKGLLLLGQPPVLRKSILLVQEQRILLDQAYVYGHSRMCKPVLHPTVQAL